MTSPLHDILLRRIATTGPITVAEYMTEALLHPQHGYYTTRDPFGTKGDFITAPEISQMFGELVGLCIAQAWMDQGAPTTAILAELGPGRGTLMADILRATKAVPGFHAAMSVHLVEASAHLRSLQAQAVPNATWHDHIGDIPEGPLFLVANEFLDALPVRQFLRNGQGWRERLVGADEDALTFGLSGPATPAVLDHRLPDTGEGDMVELCPALPATVSEAARRVDTHGGIALFIDYGCWRSLGDTFQALRDNAHADPLSAPGTADLTAHVDFEVVAAHASPAQHTELTTQGMFLERLGITQRAQALAQNLSGEALDAHIAAHRRLTHPDEMGDLFKVIGLYPNGSPPPAGCDT